MSGYSTRDRSTGGSSGTSTATGTSNATAGVSNTQAKDVVLYLTLNNTTHKNDELPEAMSALKQAEREGLGHRELLPISDPYWSKKSDGSLKYSDDTYKYSLGEEGAKRIDWWHGHDDMKSGEVDVGGERLMLGTDDVDVNDAVATAKITESWRKVLAASGMEEDYIDKVVASLLQDEDGKFKRLGSGNGATNELVQYAMAMYRAEKGEINVKNIVLSGHHWRGNDYGPNDRFDRYGGNGIWGEIPGAGHDEPHYNNDDDFFHLGDVAALKGAFPTAYSQVKSVQLAACNTDALGMAGEDGQLQTTNEFLQGTFENIEMSSYWKQVLAPPAASGYATNGEFLLDSMRLEKGKTSAAKDARINPKGLKRSLKGEDGKLEEISMKTNTASYGAAGNVGLKGGRSKDYDKRTDLAKQLYTAKTLPQTELKQVTEPPKPAAPAPKTTTSNAGTTSTSTATDERSWWQRLFG